MNSKWMEVQADRSAVVVVRILLARENHERRLRAQLRD